MCGFCGFTGSSGNNETVIAGMMDKLVHRGPDSAGQYIDSDMVFGFRRLAIIGLDDGIYPIYNEDRSLVLVFNGEIYNYQDLRTALLAKGHVFATHTDAETILHLYEEYDTGLLNFLRGMFAFALYDTKKGRLFCARDPFGIKPFYYTFAGAKRHFIFGSEIKCFYAHPDFQPELNEEALAQYLTFQYSALPETFFKGVYKLLPAHYLTLEDGELRVTRYFTPVFSPAEMSLDMAVTAIDNAVKDSVRKHMISDVEVGSFLSSGVDSSYVAACFHGAKTFTVGFDYEKYNETEYAKKLSESIGVENFSKIISTDEYWQHLPKVQYHMDEPLADPSAVALYFVSREASRHVKVALSGEGADEFFGGYNIYKEPLDIRLLTALPLPLRRFLGKWAARFPFAIKGKNLLIRASKTVEERFIGNAYIFSPKERRLILKTPENAPEANPADITGPIYAQVRHEDDITKMQYLDIHLWMTGDILLKADKMSMAHSLEVRVPFLDKEVFRVASRMPTRYRVNRAGTKYAFRRAAERHLPAETASRRKLGFPVPIRIWLREKTYYEKVRGYFLNETAQQYFHTDALMHMLDQHFSGKKDHSRKIWTVFMFLLWHEQYFSALKTHAV